MIKLPRHLSLFLFITLLFTSTVVHATCSPYKGFATINEVDQTGAANRFVELKILNPPAIGTLYKNWTIRICNSDNECTSDISYATAKDTNSPWIVAEHPLVPYRAAPNSEPYIDMDNGFDIILKDASGLTIDYFSVEGHTAQQDGACTPAFDWDWDRASAGLNNNYNTDNLRRGPDGNGQWDSPGSGNSGGDTEETTNDEPPPGGDPLPKVTVANITVIKGQTATFTFTLENTVNYAVSVDYTTTGGTAIATPASPYDYTYKTGTITFPANTTTLTQTVDISTNLVNPSTTGSVFFNLYLSNQQNAIIENHYPTGTILASQIADWQMDEATWNGTSNEVIDVTSSNYHGTAINGTTTNSLTPALAGNPGTCNYGEFDGNNDYIALTGFQNLTGSFTIAAWINADEIGKDQRIFVDDENNTGGYAFSLGDSGDGQLRFFSRDVTPISLDSSQIISVGNWYHVVAVHDSVNKTRQIFVNGADVTGGAQTYTGTWGSDNGLASIGGETDSAVGGEANSNWRFNGSIDEVRVYTDALTAEQITSIMNETHSCPISSPDHYSISHSGTGVTCKSEQITITTHDSSHAVMDPGTRTISLSTSSNRGTWSSVVTGAGTLTDATAGDGAATYTFPGGENSVVLAFDYTNPIADPDTISFNVTDGSNTETSGSATAAEDPVISFSKTGFIFNNDTDGNTTIPTQLAGKDSDVGYNAKTITLQAVKQSDSDPAECLPAFQNKTLNIDFAAECINPSSCAGQLFNLTSGAVNGDLTATTNNNSASGSISYDTRSITFDANGKVDIVFNYPESGAIELHAQHNILLADGTPSGNYMSGSSSFVVRPFALALSGLSLATDASGSVFTKAGEDFTTTFTAVRWQAADDTNNDGIADTGADLTDNVTTINFGKETVPVTPANITTSLPTVTLVPDAGVLTNSANGANFSNGVGTKTYNWSEVGIFDLTTTLTNYLGSGEDIIGRAQNVGRFIPDHFETLVTHACTSFTYSGQPFTVTALARNKANATTVNYRGTFAKGVNLTDANPAATPLGAFSNNALDSASFSISPDFGQSTVTDLTYTFVDKETIPETIEIRATDITDTTISSDTFSEGSTEIRSGRVRLENSFGSELVDMAVTAQVEFYNTNGFEINTADTCSVVTASLTDIGTDTVLVGDGSVTGQTCIWDDDAESGTDNCSDGGLLPGPVTSQFESPAVAGSFNLFLRAPGENFTGDIGITLNTPTSAWLQYDWDGDGTHNNDPTSVSSFGLYRGDDRIIYWREVFQ